MNLARGQGEFADAPGPWRQLPIRVNELRHHGPTGLSLEWAETAGRTGLSG